MKKAITALLRRIFGPLFFCIALLALSSSGCSFAVRAELLNPLNHGGRVETSTPVASPSPSPTPTPSPTPEVQK